jgi:Domain of unknown function (DUF4296)
MRRIVFILFLCCLFSCNGKDNIPSNVLKPKEMTGVLGDVLMADAMVNDKKNRDTGININTLSAAYYQQIFTLHKITKEDFFRSYKYYLNSPGLFKNILDSATVIMEKKMMSPKPTPLKNKIYEKARIRAN